MSLSFEILIARCKEESRSACSSSNYHCFLRHLPVVVVGLLRFICLLLLLLLVVVVVVAVADLVLVASFFYN